ERNPCTRGLPGQRATYRGSTAGFPRRRVAIARWASRTLSVTSYRCALWRRTARAGNARFVSRAASVPARGECPLFTAAGGARERRTGLPEVTARGGACG